MPKDAGFSRLAIWICGSQSAWLAHMNYAVQES